MNYFTKYPTDANVILKIILDAFEFIPTMDPIDHYKGLNENFSTDFPHAHANLYPTSEHLAYPV